VTRVWVYSIMHNEAILLPWWLRHYCSFADRIIVYDDASDDGTRDMLTEAGAELRDCPWTGFDDYKASLFSSVQYRESRGKADWVMWVDGDEFVYAPNIQEHLDTCQEQGIAVPRVQGYNMFSEQLPHTRDQIYTEIRLGVPDSSYSKPQVINPSITVWWGLGRDQASVEDDAKFYSHRGPSDWDAAVEEPLKNLHYRWMGSNYFRERNRRNYERYLQDYGVGASNREQVAPDFTGTLSATYYMEQAKQATTVV